jgi:hypothetical protein
MSEEQKRIYDEQWQARERERLAQVMAARERGRRVLAAKIAQDTARRRGTVRADHVA